MSHVCSTQCFDEAVAASGQAGSQAQDPGRDRSRLNLRVHSDGSLQLSRALVTATAAGSPEQLVLPACSAVVAVQQPEIVQRLYAASGAVSAQQAQQLAAALHKHCQASARVLALLQHSQQPPASAAAAALAATATAQPGTSAARSASASAAKRAGEDAATAQTSDAASAAKRPHFLLPEDMDPEDLFDDPPPGGIVYLQQQSGQQQPGQQQPGGQQQLGGQQQQQQRRPPHARSTTLVRRNAGGLVRSDDEEDDNDDDDEEVEGRLDAEIDMPLSQTDNQRPPSARIIRSTASSHHDSCVDDDAPLTKTVAGAAEAEPGTEASLWPDPSSLLATVHQRAIHDTIHGHIICEPPLVAIIDTPEFQRLRDLKQLGCTIWVYPGASHSRFEHCLGVSHLAGVMVEHLMLLDNNRFNIDERDRLCVKIAGLCHDLGHGPFSHMFERFVNRVREQEGKPHWEHEMASIQLFDHLLHVNRVDLSAYGLQLPEDTNFIKLLIMGLRPEAEWPNNLGRPPEKRFLLDIVANKRNGIDVDKLDYFMRDAISALGSPPIGCDIKRLIRSSRGMNVNGQTQVCFEEKMALGIFDIFRLRAWLHKYVYQHHTVKVVEEMICDVLTAANDHFFPMRNAAGQPCRISDAIDDMSAFALLGDWIVNAIEASTEPQLALAREILYRLRCRCLYASVNQPLSLLGNLRRLSEQDVHQQIRALLDRNTVLESQPLEEQEQLKQDTDALKALQERVAEDLVVHFVAINYGSRDSISGEADNPVCHVKFFNPKLNMDTALEINERRMPLLFMPQAFEEKLLYVYTRHDESHAALERAYNTWRRINTSVKTPGGRDGLYAVTPVVANNPGSPSKAATRLARHASGNMLPRLQGSPLRRNASLDGPRFDGDKREKAGAATTADAPIITNGKALAAGNTNGHRA